MEVNKVVRTIVTLVITLILIFLFVVPKYQESLGLEKALADKQAEYDKNSSYYARISELIKSIEGKKNILDKVDSSLPPNLSLAPLLYFFQKNGVESGITVKTVTFPQISTVSVKQGLLTNLGKEKEIRNINMTLDLLGSYQGFKNFLSSLEKSARLFEVDTISLSREEDSQKSAAPGNQLEKYNFRLQVKT